MILPVSPHKLYVQQSQQAVRGADGTSIGLDKNKPAGQLYLKDVLESFF